MSVITFAIGYYVVDEVGRAGALSGPFANPAEAEKDLREYSIADDCGVWHRDKERIVLPLPRLQLTELTSAAPAH